jgi:hypothetical protein
VSRCFRQKFNTFVLVGKPNLIDKIRLDNLHIIVLLDGYLAVIYCSTLNWCPRHMGLKVDDISFS